MNDGIRQFSEALNLKDEQQRSIAFHEVGVSRKVFYLQYLPFICCDQEGRTLPIDQKNKERIAEEFAYAENLLAKKVTEKHRQGQPVINVFFASGRTVFFEKVFSCRSIGKELRGLAALRLDALIKAFNIQTITFGSGSSSGQ
jgi:hypothetical protein